MLTEFVSCISGLDCAVNDPKHFIGELKGKAEKCGDNIPDLPSTSPDGGNADAPNGETTPCDRLSIEACFKKTSDSIFAAKTPEAKCRYSEFGSKDHKREYINCIN